MKAFIKISFLVAIGIRLLLQYSFAQTPYIEWDKTFGGNGYDNLANIVQTKDGGYVLGGYSNSGVSGEKITNSKGFSDYWIVKINASRQIEWQKTIGGNDEDKLKQIQQTADGGYILGGSSKSLASGDKTENVIGSLTNPSNDYWIVKLDALGNIEWQKTIGGDSEDELSSIQQTKDGGYIVGGWSWSDISGNKTENNINKNGAHLSDYWVVKLDALGDIQWQNTIGGYNGDELYSIKQTTDGGYILGGSSASNISGDKNQNSVDNYYDYWAVKLNAQGNIQWQTTLGGIADDRLTAIIQTKDGGYMLGGYSSSNISIYKSENTKGFSDYWILKLNAQGIVQWQKTIGGNKEDRLYSILQTDDGNYILGGWSESDISGNKSENLKGIEDYWILETDSVGNIRWQKSIGGDYVNRFSNIDPTNDGGYIVGGISHSDISGDKTESSRGYSDYWILKLSYCDKKSVVNDTICSGQNYILPSGRQVSQTGIYRDTLKTIRNCDSIIVTNLTVRQKSFQIISKNFCNGQSFNLSNGKIVTTNGIYMDTIPNICDSIIEYHLNFLNKIVINQDAVICRGKSYILPKGNSVISSGVYQDTLKTYFGCDSIIITNLVVTNPITYNQSISICEGKAFRLPNGNNVSVSGIYIDTLKHTNACDSIIITHLSFFPNTYSISLKSIDTIDVGNAIQLYPIDTQNITAHWVWSPSESLSCSNCENPIANPIKNTQYILTAIAQNGCEDTAVIQIMVRNMDIYIPSAFSPNNDGINDELGVFAINPALFDLKIFNRWGQVIFESNSIQEKWNGKYQGEDVPVDSYIYILDAQMQNGKKYQKQGIITLLR